MERKPLLSTASQSSKLSRLGHALSRRKSVNTILGQAQADGEKRLERRLGWLDLVGYGVGGTVGAGIYTLIGAGAAAAGPSISLSFVLCAFACFLTSLCYSEFAARIPVSGSAYTFAYASIGEFLAWVIGWNLTLEYGISAAAVSRGWAGYFSDLTDLDDSWLNQFEIGGDFFGSPFVGSPFAAGLVVLCTCVALVGVQGSARFNLFMTVTNVGIILFLIIAGAVFVDRENWTPFAPEGVNGMVHGAAIMFFSYIGFDAVSCMAEETINPNVNVPIGTIASVFISASLYVAVGLVATGMVPSSVLALSGAPLSDAFRNHNQEWAATVISVGCVIGGTTSTLTCIMGQPRIYFSMARDGLLGPAFTKMRGGEAVKQGVPVWGCLCTGLLAAVMAFFVPLQTLSDMISIGTLNAFAVVNAGVVVLRYENEGRHSPRALLCTAVYFFSALAFGLGANVNDFPLWMVVVPGSICVISFSCLLHFCTQTNIPQNSFKCPLVPWVPCGGILMVFYVLGGLEAASWYRFLAWTSLGILIYFTYGIGHSKLNSPVPTKLKVSSDVSEDDDGIMSPGPSATSPVQVRAPRSKDDIESQTDDGDDGHEGVSPLPHARPSTSTSSYSSIG